MTATGMSSPLAPAPLLPSKSYSSTSAQQFSSVLRPPISTTPTRDGRSRSAVTVNPTVAVTRKNFHDVMTRRFISTSSEANSRISDPLHSDHLARLNRIQTSMSQHVSTLKGYSRQLSELDTRQRSLKTDLREAKDTLENESQQRLNAAIPEITEQSKTMESVETRVETARTKLAQQVDMVFISTGHLVNGRWRISISRLLKIED